METSKNENLRSKSIVQTLRDPNPLGDLWFLLFWNFKPLGDFDYADVRGEFPSGGDVFFALLKSQSSRWFSLYRFARKKNAGGRWNFKILGGMWALLRQKSQNSMTAERKICKKKGKKILKKILKILNISKSSAVKGIWSPLGMGSWWVKQNNAFLCFLILASWKNQKS